MIGARSACRVSTIAISTGMKIRLATASLAPGAFTGTAEARFSMRKCDKARMPEPSERGARPKVPEGAPEYVRRPVHQDLLARRRDTSHAGDDRGAAKSPRCAHLLGGRGSVRAAGAAACRRRRGDPGGLAAMAQGAAPARHMARAEGFRGGAARPFLRRDHRYPGPGAHGRDRQARARPPSWLRRAQRSRAACGPILRRAASGRSGPARDRAKSLVDRAGIGSHARRRPRFRPRPGWTGRRGRAPLTASCCTPRRDPARNGRSSLGSRSAGCCLAAVSSFCCRGGRPSSGIAACAWRPRSAMRACRNAGRSMRSPG